MTAETDPEKLHDHYMSPSYFAPEIVKVAYDWWDASEVKRKAYVKDDGPSPVPELLEGLKTHGITDPVEVMELIILASGKLQEKSKEE